MRAANWSRRLGTIPQWVVDTSLVALLPLLALVAFLIALPPTWPRLLGVYRVAVSATRRMPGPAPSPTRWPSAWRSARWRYVTEPSRLTDDAGTPGA